MLVMEALALVEADDGGFFTVGVWFGAFFGVGVGVFRAGEGVLASVGECVVIFGMALTGISSSLAKT